MKSITLIQPWATCIAHHGKRVENRTWRPPAGLIGQQLAIHAGKKVDWGVYADLVAEGIFGDQESRRTGETMVIDGVEWFTTEPINIPTGAIVAVATVAGVYTEREPPPADQLQWWDGGVGWALSNVRALAEPVPCRGAQGLWEVPADVLAQVLEQLRKK